MGKVSIVKTDSGIDQALCQALSLAGGIKSFIQSHDHVLIKPNLNDFDCITSPLLIDALVRHLLEAGIRNIVVAESTFGNAAVTETHFRKSGYYSLCEKYGIPLINLNKSDTVECEVKHPLVMNRIRIAKDVFEATKIINIPVMKVHYATRITLGLKNLKGFLPPEEKIRFHESGLEKAIADMNSLIPVNLTIIDGITCMERMGPKGGDVFDLGLILAGINRAETDYVGAKIMGFDPAKIDHLRYYIESNHLDMSGIEVCGERLEDVLRPFKQVCMENLIPENASVYDCNACSTCMNALLLSFQFLGQSLTEKTGFYLGKNINREKHSDKKTIAFGNCALSKTADLCIRGCPPYPLALKEKLKLK